MLRTHDDLATKSDVSAVREDLKHEMAAMRSELKQEIAGVRADLHSFIRTFIAVQAATVVGATGIVYALVQLT